jgi:hypothetical protein
MNLHRLPVWLAGLCLLATSCVPESENALSDANTASPDATVYGLWSIVHDNGDVQYLHVGAATGSDDAAAQPKLMQFCLLTHKADTKELSQPFAPRFFTARLDDASYANVISEPENNQGKRTYWFFKYAVDGDRLSVWGLNWEETARVIEAGQLKGTVERDGKSRLTKVYITDTTENLQRFLRGGGDRTLFSESGKMVYSRVGR